MSGSACRIPTCPTGPGDVCRVCGKNSRCWSTDRCVVDQQCPFVGTCLVAIARNGEEVPGGE